MTEHTRPEQSRKVGAPGTGSELVVHDQWTQRLLDVLVVELLIVVLVTRSLAT